MASGGGRFATAKDGWVEPSSMLAMTSRVVRVSGGPPLTPSTEDGPVERVQPRTDLRYSNSNVVHHRIGDPRVDKRVCQGETMLRDELFPCHAIGA